MSIIESIISGLFGSKSERDIKEVMPVVEAIKASYEKVKELSNDQLRAKTNELRKFFTEYISDDENQIKELKANAEAEVVDMGKKEAIFSEIDKLEKALDDKIEKALTW